MLTDQDIKKLASTLVKKLGEHFVPRSEIHSDDTLTPKEAKQLREAEKEFVRNGGTPWEGVKRKLKL